MVEYAAIWRAWQLTEQDMQRLRHRSTMRRFSRSLQQLSPALASVGVAAAGATKSMLAAVQAAQEAHARMQVERMWKERMTHVD